VPFFLTIDSSDSKRACEVLSHFQGLKRVSGSISIGLIQNRPLKNYLDQNGRPADEGNATGRGPIMGRGGAMRGNGARMSAAGMGGLDVEMQSDRSRLGGDRVRSARKSGE
jgi:hypothetical protein